MRGLRKYRALQWSLLAVVLVALVGAKVGLTERGLDTACYAILGCLAAFGTSNAAEWWTQRGPPQAKGPEDT